MAAPKKRTSKSKKNIRKNAWKKKVVKQAMRALFIAKLAQFDIGNVSLTTENSNLE
uniref:Large ribosomal subunit protein bL32c n=1 Tax=Schizomeris leibleinii TaxID=104533 RepID=F8SYE0_9CHLO|nr:ribosomal protein L32 [Schizomeris leibleinii]AEH05390.1 ribosomal protein L32 [Schizomeris leibleinii]